MILIKYIYIIKIKKSLLLINIYLKYRIIITLLLLKNIKNFFNLYLLLKIVNKAKNIIYKTIIYLNNWLNILFIFSLEIFDNIFIY